MKASAFWGGTLTSLSLDVTTRIAVFAVHVLDGGVDSDYLLKLAEVSEFRLVNPTEVPWDFTEVTEIHCSRDESTGAWSLEMLLWSEDATITVRCESIEIDGVPLEQT